MVFTLSSAVIGYNLQRWGTSQGLHKDPLGRFRAGQGPTKPQLPFNQEKKNKKKTFCQKRLIELAV